VTRAPLRYAILLIGIVGLSMAGVFYKLSAAPVATIVAYRMLMATLLTVPLALMSGVLAPRQGRVRTLLPRRPAPPPASCSGRCRMCVRNRVRFRRPRRAPSCASLLPCRRAHRPIRDRRRLRRP